MSAHEPWCTRSHNDATCKTDIEPPDPERYEVPDQAYEDTDFEWDEVEEEKEEDEDE